MQKLVGGVVPITPSAGRELEHFTTYEAHRAKRYVHICKALQSIIHKNVRRPPFLGWVTIVNPTVCMYFGYQSFAIL